jgi:hypothetical protein
MYKSFFMVNNTVEGKMIPHSSSSGFSSPNRRKGDTFTAGKNKPAVFFNKKIKRRAKARPCN